jgi:DNA-binding NtrC family response regulator
MSTGRILIVDDDAAVLDVLQQFLQKAGYESRAFLEAGDAITAVRSERFDLAIVDLRLGRKNGLEVMKAFHETDPDTPVIILTGHGTVESAVEAMELGAFNFLTKPIKKDELLFQVKQALEKSTLLRDIRTLKEAAGKNGINDLISPESATGVRVRPYHESRDAFERQYLIRLLDINRGDITKAAKSAELSEDELSRLLRKHGIGFRDARQ